MIRFSNVVKRYRGGREALGGVSFTVERGEFVYLSGHSGAGKSTVFRLIAAIERPTAGTVLVNEQNVGRLGLRAVPHLRRQLGLILQDHHLLHDRTVLENVLLPLRAVGADPDEARRRARAALDKVGLLDRERARPVALSGGEQQRVCIARAISHRPAVLIADEPTANVDAGHADEIVSLFEDFHRVGVTVLIATHDLALIARHPGRVLRLDHGRLTDTGA